MDRKIFYDKVRGSFGSLKQSQVEGFEVLLNEGEKRNASIFDTAYVLATAWHETAKTMQPITEYGSKAYLQSKKYWPYIGRGYVQLTWKDNYEKYGIAERPEDALKPSVAAYIIWDGMQKGIFTGKKLSDFTDFKNARKIVNGMDKADLIGGYGKLFQEALQAASIQPATPIPEKPKTGSTGLQLTLGGILIAILAAVAKALGVY